MLWRNLDHHQLSGIYSLTQSFAILECKDEKLLKLQMNSFYFEITCENANDKAEWSRYFAVWAEIKEKKKGTQKFLKTTQKG